MTNENQLAKIISFTRELESILKVKFHARGKGLHTYLDSVESKLDSGLVRNLRYIATIRNKSMHESNFKIDDFYRYEKIAKESIFALKNTTVSTRMNTKERPNQRNRRENPKRTESRGNSFFKKVRNIVFMIVFLFLLMNAKVIGLWITYSFENDNVNIKEEVKLSDENGDINEITYPYAVKEVVHVAPKPFFKCIGKKYCSQMSSCAEATFYINHCPNTRMDGDGDGIPCRRQWCH